MKIEREVIDLYAGIIFMTLAVLVFLFYLYYSGLFVKVIIYAGKSHVPVYKVVYKFQVGSKKDMSDIFKEIGRIAPGEKCFTLWYDPSKKGGDVPQPWVAGCILSESQLSADDTLLKTFLKKDFKYYEFKFTEKMLKTTFPATTPLSVLIGTKKMWKSWNQYVEEKELNASPVFEVYQNAEIIFMAPLQNHKKYYVPESLEIFQVERRKKR